MAKYPEELYPNGCPCLDCLKLTGEDWKMTLCPKCGSKRCPGSMNHTQHGVTNPTTKREVVSPNEYRQLIEIRDSLNAAHEDKDWAEVDKTSARLSALLGSLIGHKAR